MAYRTKALQYAVRPRVLIKYLGQLTMALAFLTVPPLGVALVNLEWEMAACLGGAALFASATGYAMSRVRATEEVQLNEAVVLTALTFVLAPLLAWPAMLAAGLGPLDGLFEAISGVTTTGLSTTATVEDKSATFLFLRSWLQWFGGLEIVVFTLVLAGRSALPARGLTTAEEFSGDLAGGVRLYARRVLAAYSFLTAAGVLMLFAAGLPAFHALLYTLSAVSTGGFAPLDESLAPYSRMVQCVTLLFALGGAMPLVAYYKAIRRENLRAMINWELGLLLGGAAATGTALVLFMRLGGWSWSESLWDGLFTAVSAQTTTGYSTVAISELPVVTKVFLIFSMITGGEIGATAGGIKTIRLLILFMVVRHWVIQTTLPKHAVSKAYVGGLSIPADVVQQAMAIIVMFIIVAMLSWVPFVAAGFEPLDALFEVVSATGTVGLSTGITGPDLDPWLKGVLCADMLLGRLEVAAWLVLFYPGAWWGTRVKAI